ncbi:cell wall hydrolase [Nitratireductor sp. XY-223]|uniref:cell wall hydrolase n=1 Tax=Nitratireductor sp. XY-223 TaxID=2561926 RepID=UPI0010AA4766|nr:cell wall hydrolase [Nitratireductor sp. XY-223]
MFRIVTSIAMWVLMTLAVCGPANAASLFALKMTLASPGFLMVTPRVPLVDWRNAGRERYCLALAIYHEARGEPAHGQHAVAVTILNRVRSSAYPDTVCGVVFQNAHKFNRCQFSFACDRLSDFPKNAAAFRRSHEVAEFTTRFDAAMDHELAPGAPFAMLRGMTHYHRHDVRPVWSKKLKRLARIGDHVFFRSERVVSRYRAAPVAMLVRTASVAN